MPGKISKLYDLSPPSSVLFHQLEKNEIIRSVAHLCRVLNIFIFWMQDDHGADELYKQKSREYVIQIQVIRGCSWRSILEIYHIHACTEVMLISTFDSTTQCCWVINFDIYHIARDKTMRHKRPALGKTIKCCFRDLFLN